MAKPNYDAPAVRYAIQLISLLSESRDALGVSEISKALGINKNMVFRLLATLEDEGWIATEELGPKYSMTFLPFQITSKPVNRRTVEEKARKPLEELWKKHGESTYMAIHHKDCAMYVKHFNSTKSVRIAGMIGGCYPLHCTAPGKVLLAFAGDEYFNRLVKSELKCYTGNTICGRTQLWKHLQEIRKNSYAVDNEEYGKGILCFSVPVFSYDEEVVASIGISATSVQYTLEEFISAVREDVIEAGRVISE